MTMTAPRHSPSLGRDSSGASAVEFAMVLPVLLAVLVGVLEFGRALWLRHDMQFAVEEAARFALANDTATTTAISARASSRLAAIGPNSAVVQIATIIDAAAVTITASTDFQPVVPGLLPPGTITLTARARMPR